MFQLAWLYPDSAAGNINTVMFPRSDKTFRIKTYFIKEQSQWGGQRGSLSWIYFRTSQRDVQGTIWNIRRAWSSMASVWEDRNSFNVIEISAGSGLGHPVEVSVIGTIGDLWLSLKKPRGCIPETSAGEWLKAIGEEKEDCDLTMFWCDISAANPDVPFSSDAADGLNEPDVMGAIGDHKRGWQFSLHKRRE